MTYPLALYRDGAAFVWDGRPTDTLTVNDEAAHEAAKREGWQVARDYLAAKPKPSFDHDGDGKPGGSKAPEGDIAALRAAYTDKLGKRPFPGWDADELHRRMAAAG
jgi:hypothetical protein